MPTHAEKRHLPYTPEQLFDLVADVERYPEFLPWCIESKIVGREGNVFYADLIIGYKLFREKFGSKVSLDRPNHVHVQYLRGPMKHLSNHWRFIPMPDGGCMIDFYVDFEFKNPVFQKLMGVFFNEIVRRMVGAFEARATELYAASASGGKAARSQSGRQS
ncbi:MAG TPA: type II toxin-antitoxin system RatA family toxin [Alphaproteobacteria bacterium]|nr:type II toxin-antitoxin system RatA family toxin [Micavibrio sp.]MBK9563257.1 type II toxin-antitoxin system RatA family toxin [Micavibrio sp.]HQX26981.1 type II toxin-antitoxin system RatA family toxin [Alphaproteobacteria bacterium]